MFNFLSNICTHSESRLGDLGMGQEKNIWNNDDFSLSVANFFSQLKKQEKPFAGKCASALECLVDLLEPRVKSVLIFGGTGGGVSFLPAL